MTLRRWHAELMMALLVGAIGAFFLSQGLRLPPPDEPGVPGPGTAPILLGGFMVAGAALVGFSALLGPRGETLALGGFKPAFALVSLVLGAVLFEPAGFLLATFLFLTAGFIVLGGADWRRAAPAAALFAGLLWLIFTKLLGVGLPYGLIGEVLFR